MPLNLCCSLFWLLQSFQIHIKYRLHKSKLVWGTVNPSAGSMKTNVFCLNRHRSVTDHSLHLQALSFRDKHVCCLVVDRAEGENTGRKEMGIWRKIETEVGEEQYNESSNRIDPAYQLQVSLLEHNPDPMVLWINTAGIEWGFLGLCDKVMGSNEKFSTDKTKAHEFLSHTYL